jgi:hypothetical protein
LIAVGGFHEHAHTMFSFTEMFWHCFVKRCCDELELERVKEVTQDLQHNNYSHHQNFHHVATIAAVSFLMQDVTDPPPSMFVADPARYLANVQNATGIVLLKYLMYAGFPTLQWQRSARNGRGQMVKKLFAYSFHVYRSAAHKPVCVQIALLALLGFCCALPALQTVLLATVSISLLGKPSCNVYVDRLVEMINKLQQGTKRSCNAASFGAAIDMTTLLRAWLHVKHAYQASETGFSETDDPITPSMLVQARILQNLFRQKCGTDLTVATLNNELWHTGHGVPLAGEPWKQRRPWELIERVESGKTGGKGGRRAETARHFAQRFIFEHFFRY